MTTTLKLKKMSVALLSALMLLGLLATLFPGYASAHGRRTIGNGKYQVVFGFLSEPAFAGQQNGIDLTICQGDCQTNADGTLKNPVKDADKTLKAEVIYGSETKPVTLTPRFRADGKYNGVFFPAKAGDYTFHFTGNINGDAIDERVTSGKDGFNSVEDSTPLMFPAAGNSDAAMAQQLKDAQDKASTASTLGIAGIVVGLIGLAVGGASLLRRPKAIAPVSSESQTPVSSGSGRGPQAG